MPKMLLCEPEEDLATAVRDFFVADNYTVNLETSGWRVLECLRQEHYDIIVLEMSLYTLDGLAVVRDYRASGGSTPILLLTGNVSSAELQAVYDAGADAYLAKPFKLADLAAQLRAMLRRPGLCNEELLTMSNLVMDTKTGAVTKDKHVIHLFPMEFKLLQFLMKHPNQIFDTRVLFERIWQKEDRSSGDTVRTHIRTLRAKIDSQGCPSLITTVRGLGYMIESISEVEQEKRKGKVKLLAAKVLPLFGTTD